MGNKKGAQTKTESTTTASPEAMAAYRDILARATTEADKPYEAYTGDRVAGFSPDQLAAFQSTRDAQGIASPFLTEATGMARAGAAPIDAAAIARYQNPYQQSVIDTTMADLQRQNAIAQSQVTGNAALRGALGGSRVGVAQALTAGEQGRTQASTLANLYSGGYDRALAAAQQDRAASSSGASLMAGLGDASSTAAYRDVASLYGMGQQQQGNQQAGLDTAYQAWQQQQAFPTQQISWLSDVAGRAGSAMGSSTTGTKTDPAPNPWSAILGAAGTVAGAALGGPMGASIGGSLGGSLGGTMGGGSASPNMSSIYADGGVVPSYAAGGVVKGYEDGGIIDLASDGTGAWALPAAGAEAMPTEMAGTMDGTQSGGFNWQSIGNPLMQAGLKMMSSTSPYLGVAIGEGGTAGMKAYGDNQKVDADKKHKEAQIKLQADRLRQSAQQHRDTLDARREETRYTWGRDENNRLVRLPMRGGEEPRVVEGITMAPTGRSGAAGEGGVYGFKYRMWLAANPGDTAGALDHAGGKKEMSEPDALRAARLEAGRDSRALSLRGERRDEFIRDETARIMEQFRAAGVRSRVPTPPPVDPAAVEGLGRRFGAPAAAARTGATPPPRPSDVPAVPGPLPREGSMPAPVGPTPMPVSLPRPPGMSNEQLKAAAQVRLANARSTEEKNAILRQLREWGVTP